MDPFFPASMNRITIILVVDNHFFLYLCSDTINLLIKKIIHTLTVIVRILTHHGCFYTLDHDIVRQRREI